MICPCIPRIELGTRAEARNKEVERALSMGAEYILFMDTDQTMPDNAVEEMMKLNVDIAVIDTPPHDLDIPNVTYNPDGSIAYCTVACSLIRASVFTSLGMPWFSSAYDFVFTQVNYNGKKEFKMLDKAVDNNVGEDIYFVRKAIEAGFTIGMVPKLKCKHFRIS